MLISHLLNRIFKVIIYTIIAFYSYLSCIHNTYCKKESKNIDISSGALTVHKENGEAIFSDNVVANLFDTKIITSKLIVHFDINNLSKAKLGKKSTDIKQVLSKIIIPNKLVLRSVDNSQIITADSGYYLEKDRQFVLNGNVHIKKNNDIVVTKSFVYSLKNK